MQKQRKASTMEGSRQRRPRKDYVESSEQVNLPHDIDTDDMKNLVLGLKRIRQRWCYPLFSLKTVRWHRLSPFAKRLVLLAALSATIALTKLYQIYKAETNPSPFLKSKYNYLPSKIRGVAPPANLFTFPSPQERIQFYMGDWYNDTDVTTEFKASLCNDVEYWKPDMPEIGKPYRFTESNIEERVYQGWRKRLPWRPLRSHPADAGLYHYLTVRQHREKYRYDNPGAWPYWPSEKQMVLQFGDGKDSAKFLSTPYPVMVKTRLSGWVYEERYANAPNNGNHHPPILGMYEIHRHYNDHFYETDDLWEELPWHSKRDTLVWRGSSSGQRRKVIEQYIDYPDQDIIDVAFSEILKVHQGKLPRSDSHYLRDEMTVRQLLSHKYLLVLEGWGMASGLKWMLFSNSVVFMAPPTKTSWAMEEKLVPYVHYVPLWQNHSNLPQQLEWARTHDEECRKIALYSRHYMERLVTSPQAQNETIEILLGMDEIYQQLYGPTLLKCGRK